MTDDLVKRLRDLARGPDGHLRILRGTVEELEEAADEIKRLRGFAKSIKNLWAAADFMDLDGFDVQEVFLKSGLAVHRPATAEEIEGDDYLIEYGTEVGDPIIRWEGDWWR